ncbi:1618_t:CDS:1, partial [Racocetra persica]
FPSPGLPIYIQSNEDTSLYWTANEGNFIYLMSPTTSNTQVWMIIKGNDNTYSIVSQKEGRSYAVTYVPIETCFTIEPYIEDKMEQKFRIESQNGSSPVAISIKEQTLYAIADQEKGFAEGSRIVTGAVNKKQWNLAPYISQIFYGTLIHSLSLTELKIISNALLGVDNCGKIAFLEPNVSNEQTLCDIIKRWGSTKDK